jgi:hypothetical protein
VFTRVCFRVWPSALGVSTIFVGFLLPLAVEGLRLGLVVPAWQIFRPHNAKKEPNNKACNWKKFRPNVNIFSKRESKEAAFSDKDGYYHIPTLNSNSFYMSIHMFSNAF